MHPVVPSGGGYAPPNIVPVYAPGQLQPQPQKVKRSPSLPSKPAAPQVTTLLVTETVPPAANGDLQSLGVIGGMLSFLKLLRHYFYTNSRTLWSKCQC